MFKKIASLSLNFIQVLVFLALMVPALLALGSMKEALQQTRAETEIVISKIFALNSAVEGVKFDAVQVQQWLTDISATRALDGLDDGDEKAAEFAESFRTNLTTAKTLAHELELKDVESPLLQLEKDFPAYYATGQKMAAAYIAEGPAGGNLIMGEFDGEAEKIANSMDTLLSALGKVTTEKQALVQQNLADATQKTADIYTSVVITLFIATLIAVASTMLVSRQRRRMLLSLADSFQEKVSGAINQMTGAVENLLDRSNAMRNGASQATERANTVTSESQSTSNNIQIVASSVEELASSVEEISRQVSLSFDLVQNTKNQTNSANDSARRLGDATQNITAVVGSIENIASQISMLALNATIESARAGEAGKGFAVVANEVKNLANETAKATADITHRLAEIQASSGIVVDAMGSLESSVSTLNDYITGIATAVEEQSAVTQDLSSTMRGMATSTANVSDSIEEVKTLSSETSQEAGKVATTCQGLAELAQTLEHAVEHFLGSLKAR